MKWNVNGYLSLGLVFSIGTVDVWYVCLFTFVNLYFPRALQGDDALHNRQQRS